jgi:hypothetical protein
MEPGVNLLQVAGAEVTSTVDPTIAGILQDQRFAIEAFGFIPISGVAQFAEHLMGLGLNTTGFPSARVGADRPTLAWHGTWVCRRDFKRGGACPDSPCDFNGPPVISTATP